MCAIIVAIRCIRVCSVCVHSSTTKPNRMHVKRIKNILLMITSCDLNEINNNENNICLEFLLKQKRPCSVQIFFNSHAIKFRVRVRC